MYQQSKFRTVEPNHQLAIYMWFLVVTLIIVPVWGILAFLFWPVHQLLAVLLLAIAVGYGGFRGYIHIGHHRAELAMARNRAKVIHESDHGVILLHKNEIIRHSHANYVEQPTVIPSLPTTFRELVQKKFVGPNENIVIGFSDHGEPIGLSAPTSLGISGVPGSGKTNTLMALVLATIAKYNGKVKLLVVDPHMYVDGDQSLWSVLSPLEPFLLRYGGLSNPTLGGDELIDWLEVIKREMDARKQGTRGDTWVIVMDEFAAIMRSDAGRPVGEMLESLNQEGRKFNMYAFLASQEWRGDRSGGTPLRHAITSFAVMNTPAAIASLIIPESEAQMAPKLRRGEVLFHTMGSTVKGSIVKIESGDAERFVRLYDSTIIDGEVVYENSR